MPVNYVSPFLMEEFDTAGLLVGYTAVNAGGTEDSLIILRIINASNTTVIISYDGVTDHDILIMNTDVLYNLQSNSEPQNFVYRLKKGTTFYVRGTAGIGSIYFSGWY